MTSRLAKYFQDYEEAHRSPGNKWTHYFGIPMIIVGLLGLAGSLSWDVGNVGNVILSPYFRVDLAIILWLPVAAWYLFLDWKIGIPFDMVLLGFYFLSRATPLYMDISLFLMGWILQGVGHAVFEKNYPAFSKNLIHLLIGPLWIFTRLVGYSD